MKHLFPIPLTDSIVEEVTRHEIYYFVDGFAGYNRISVVEEDKLNTRFVVEDGIYAYNQMPFGLYNTPTPFQRIILHIFDKMSVGNSRPFSTIGLSLVHRTHLVALRECMERCKREWMTLNPKKCRFIVLQGMLLGHIVCKARFKTDSNKVRVIVEMEEPTNITRVKSFLGHKEYCWRFIKIFAHISYLLDKLTQKGQPYT